MKGLILNCFNKSIPTLKIKIDDSIIVPKPSFSEMSLSILICLNDAVILVAANVEHVYVVLALGILMLHKLVDDD